MENNYNDYLATKLSAVVEYIGRIPGAVLGEVRWFVRADEDDPEYVGEVKANVHLKEYNEKVMSSYLLKCPVLGSVDVFLDDVDCFTMMFRDFPRVETKVLDGSNLQFDDQYQLWFKTDTIN